MDVVQPESLVEIKQISGCETYSVSLRTRHRNGHGHVVYLDRIR